MLTADSQYQQANLSYIQAQGQRLQDKAALLQALGGGDLEIATATPAAQR